jgi:hypothetical protein
MTNETEVEPAIVGEVGNVAALAVRELSGALVRPAGNLGAIEEAFEEYQLLCRKLLNDSDYQRIGKGRYPKRSAWRKLAVAFGVTFQIVDRHAFHEGNDLLSAEFVVRAIAPNGRFADGWGSCSLYERCCFPDCTNTRDNHKHCPAARGEECPGVTHFSHHAHDIPATAETRAKNRACADLFGMGEVSAEEIEGIEGSPYDQGGGQSHPRSKPKARSGSGARARATTSQAPAASHASPSTSIDQSSLARLSLELKERLLDHFGSPKIAESFVRTFLKDRKVKPDGPVTSDDEAKLTERVFGEVKHDEAVERVVDSLDAKVAQDTQSQETLDAS